MKFLFVTGGSAATVFTVTSLATSVRNAGHEVLLAVNGPLVESATAVGLPAVPVAPESIYHYMLNDRSGSPAVPPGDAPEEMRFTGRGFARMAAASLDALNRLAEDWPPDVVVGGSMAYAGGMLATRLQVPFVRVAWDIVPTTDTDAGAEDELRPELRRLGLTALPEPDLDVDIRPPSLRPPDAPDAQLMRWIPGNRQGRLEPWMYTRPEGRKRVLITSGTRALTLHSAGSLRYLVDELARAGAETLIAAPDRAAEELGTEFGDVHIGWIPLDVVAPTCDVMVHHGGGVTAMTAAIAGVPQLITPEGAYMDVVARTLAGAGAARTLGLQRQRPEQEAVEATAAGCGEILAGPRYAESARALANEIATLPTPSDVVRTLEKLASA